MFQNKEFKCHKLIQTTSSQSWFVHLTTSLSHETRKLQLPKILCMLIFLDNSFNCLFLFPSLLLEHTSSYATNKKLRHVFGLNVNQSFCEIFKCLQSLVIVAQLCILRSSFKWRINNALILEVFQGGVFFFHLLPCPFDLLFTFVYVLPELGQDTQWHFLVEFLVPILLRLNRPYKSQGGLNQFHTVWIGCKCC